jgi:hypothetical protein
MPEPAIKSESSAEISEFVEVVAGDGDHAEPPPPEIAPTGLEW